MIRMEIIRALEIDHSDDYTKGVAPMQASLKGLFRIDSDDYQRYIDKTVVIRGVELKITPRMYRTKERAGPRYTDEQRGICITIFDAYQHQYRKTGKNYISHEVFDEHFLNMDNIEVIKQTTPQRGRGSPTLNNSRFLVIKSTIEGQSKIDIGSSVLIQGRKFNLMYEGMQKYCFNCEEKHGVPFFSKFPARK